MGDLRKSVYVQRGAHAPSGQEDQRTNFRCGFGHGEITGRTFGIGDFLNNYHLSVDQMAAIDPLPNLIPLQPYPDPYVEERKTRSEHTVEKDVGSWPCQFNKAVSESQKRFPRQADWMHKWAERVYLVEDGNAKIKK